MEWKKLFPNIIKLQSTVTSKVKKSWQKQNINYMNWNRWSCSNSKRLKKI